MLSLEGNPVAEALEEREVDLCITDSIEVVTLGVTVGPEVGIVGTCTPVRAGGITVRVAVVPILISFLDSVDE